MRVHRSLVQMEPLMLADATGAIAAGACELKPLGLALGEQYVREGFTYQREFLRIHRGAECVAWSAWSAPFAIW
jgi:hypothetical protein